MADYLQYSHRFQLNTIKTEDGLEIEKQETASAEVISQKAASSVEK